MQNGQQPVGAVGKALGRMAQPDVAIAGIVSRWRRHDEADFGQHVEARQEANPRFNGLGAVEMKVQAAAAGPGLGRWR